MHLHFSGAIHVRSSIYQPIYGKTRYTPDPTTYTYRPTAIINAKTRCMPDPMTYTYRPTAIIYAKTRCTPDPMTYTYRPRPKQFDLPNENDVG